MWIRKRRERTRKTFYRKWKKVRNTKRVELCCYVCANKNKKKSFFKHWAKEW